MTIEMKIAWTVKDLDNPDRKISASEADQIITKFLAINNSRGQILNGIEIRSQITERQ
jgi:hypothetical protein